MQAPDRTVTCSYVGSELNLPTRHALEGVFARALRPYVVGDVLEVGAGLGGTSHFLCDGRQRSWTSLEPDADLLRQLKASLAAHPLPSPARALRSTVSALPADERFDTILDIDVLEHIDDDLGELARSATHLRQAVTSSSWHRPIKRSTVPSTRRSGTSAATTRGRFLRPLRPCSNPSRRPLMPPVWPHRWPTVCCCEHPFPPAARSCSGIECSSSFRA